MGSIFVFEVKASRVFAMNMFLFNWFDYFSFQLFEMIVFQDLSCYVFFISSSLSMILTT